MSYQLPSDISDRLQAHLSTGVYHSAEEVLRSAMDALDQLEQDKLLRWNERNCLAVEQSNQGLSKPLDDDAVLNRLRARLAEDGVV